MQPAGLPATKEPWQSLDRWVDDARAADPALWNATALATVDEQGVPSVRMVLAKSCGRAGVEFFTNLQSRKATDLAQRPIAALCFHWTSLGRQLRIEGPVERVSGERSDAYFATRDRASQIGAWASEQSREMRDPQELADRIAAIERSTVDLAIRRPPDWGGYVLTPRRIEFWINGEARLHERHEYRLVTDGWEHRSLYP